MAAGTPSQPQIYSAGSTLSFPTRGAVKEAASQSWLASSLVVISGTGASALLAKAAADAPAIYGLAPQAAVGTASAVPPNYLYGTEHTPFHLRDTTLEISISNASLSGANIGANGVTYAGGGTSGVALAPGQQYGLITLTSGTYSGIQMLDVTETTVKIFEIVGLHPDFSTTDTNPRVLVKMIPSAIQG